MREWTIDELMVAALARELPDDTVCFNGAVSFIPVTAFLLDDSNAAATFTAFGLPADPL